MAKDPCGLGYLSELWFPNLWDVCNIPCPTDFHRCYFVSCTPLCKHSCAQGQILLARGEFIAAWDQVQNQLNFAIKKRVVSETSSFQPSKPCAGCLEHVSCLDCSVWNLIWAPGWAGRRVWKIWHWLISCFTGPTTPKVHFLAKTENVQATACNDMQSRGKMEIVRERKNTHKEYIISWNQINSTTFHLNGLDWQAERKRRKRVSFNSCQYLFT